MNIATLLILSVPLWAAAQGAPAPPLSVARSTPVNPATADLLARRAMRTEATDKRAASIAAAGDDGLLRHGTNIAKQALLDCQKGDYPGGGMGALSLPDGRAESRTAHCWR